MIIPKTTKVERLSENINVHDFKLSDDEYESISALNQDARLFNTKTFKAYGWNYAPYFD